MHLLSKFGNSFEKSLYKSNQEYCRFSIDPEEVSNAMNIFKKQEFRVIEITKTVENFLEECKKIETLHFNRDILSNPAIIKSQGSSR